MGGEIDRELDRTLEVQCNDVLQVRIALQLLAGGGRFGGDALDASPE
nr:hypothetical protein [Nitrospira moscoviensis]